jgi:hypothetical protein
VVSFAWIHVALLLASSADAILVHDPIDAVLAHAQEHGQFAMPQGIVQLMPLLNRHCDLLIFEGSRALEIQTATCKREGPYHLAFAIGAVGSRQLLGQFHLLCDF